MGNCSYVNQEKSGPSKGWYCNKTETYVESSLWKNYCSGSTSCRYCPYLGGDDRFRYPNGSRESGRSDSREGYSGYSGNAYSQQQSRQAAPEPEDAYEPYSYGRYTGGGGTGGYSGSGGGLLDGIFGIFTDILDGGFKLLVGGGGILIAALLIVFLLWNGIRFLGAQIGIVKSPLTVMLSIPEDSGISAEEMSIVCISDSGTGKAVTASFDEEGVCDLELKKGVYEIIQKYDGISVCRGHAGIDGMQEYTMEIDADMVNRYILCFTFCDEEGNEVVPETVSITGSDGSRLETVSLDGKEYICPMVELTDIDTLLVHADEYEEVQVIPETGSRIMNCRVVLR